MIAYWKHPRRGVRRLAGPWGAFEIRDRPDGQVDLRRLSETGRCAANHGRCPTVLAAKQRCLDLALQLGYHVTPASWGSAWEVSTIPGNTAGRCRPKSA